jgi:hypothetical protein
MRVSHEVSDRGVFFLKRQGLWPGIIQMPPKVAAAHVSDNQFLSCNRRAGGGWTSKDVLSIATYPSEAHMKKR